MASFRLRADLSYSPIMGMPLETDMTKVGERWSMVTSTPFLAKSTEIFQRSAGCVVEDRAPNEQSLTS